MTKRLDEQMKENNKTIGENNKKIAECEKRLDKTTMSANQLARKANALRKELRDTVKSLQPEKYAALEKDDFFGIVCIAGNNLLLSSLKGSSPTAIWEK